MSRQLVIRLAPNEATATWLLVDEHGAPRAALARGPLAEAATIAREHPVVVLLSDVAVTRSVTDLPVSGKKLAQALPYALEDQFAGDVDDLHFAAGAADDAGTREVAAVDESTLAEVIATLAQAGIAPRAIHTVHDALPPLDGFVQLLALGDEVWLRGGHGDIASLRGLGPESIYDTWLASQDDAAEPLNVRLYLDAAAERAFAGDIERLRERDADIKPFGDDALIFLARQLVSRPGINLLQGQFAPRSDIAARLKPWSLAAALAGIALLFGLVGKYADYRALVAESARLDGDLAQLLTRVAPTADLSTNVEGQVGVMIRRATGSRGPATGGPGSTEADFLPAMGALASALRGVGDAAALDSVSYRGGILEVRLKVPNAQALDRLTQQISESGSLTAQIQRTVQADDAIESFVQIRGATQ